MIFQSLYIQGFKSFANKTLIEFPAGITAIVGPNGSGKSNIMDSLRWVFGEQRAAELRGTDMGDVIFAGADNRKPAGFAEVGLTLSDLPNEITAKWGTFSDITVTRKIYRTGEREYYINGRKCRLKDIKDIFFDTGLGSRSISIIEQERVTKIVNSSPEELRYFLEETAGVTRYKERRKEAETRLKQTKDNLARIDDLLGILSKDMEHLSLQVERVQEYRALRERRNKYEKQFFCVAYAQFIKDKQNLESAIEQNKFSSGDIVSKHQSQIDEETNQKKLFEEIREKLKTLRAEYEQAREAQSHAEGDIRQYEANIASAEHQKVQLSEDIAKAEERIRGIAARLGALSETIQDTFDMVSDFEEKSENYAAEIAEHKALLERSNDELKRHNKKYIEVSQQLTDCTNKLTIKQAELGGHRSTEARLIKEKQEILDESGTIDNRIKTLQESIADIEQNKNTLNKLLSELKESNKEDEKILSDMQKQHSTLEVELKTVSNNIEFLKKEITSKMTSEEGQTLITEFGGRAYTDIVELSGVEYMLYADLLIFDDNVKEQLLDRIKDLDVTMKFIFASQLDELLSETPLVHIQGRLHKHGALYKNIGTDNPAHALRSLRQDLETSIDKRSELESKIFQIAENIGKLRALLDERKIKYTESENEFHQLDTHYTETSTELKHLMDQKQRSQRNASVVDKEIERSRQDAEITQREMSALENKFDQINKIHQKADEERKIIEEKLDNIQEQIEEMQDEHAAATRELARYSERKAALQTEKSQLNKDKSDAQNSLETLNARLRNLTDVQAEEWAEKLSQSRVRKDELTKIVLHKSDEISVAEQQHIEIEKYLTELRKQLDILLGELHEIDKKVSEYRAKMETVVDNMEELRRQVATNYNDNIDLIYKELSMGASSKQRIQEEITKLDESINAMGALNMAAEDEYNTKSEQFHLQSGQKKDIENAAESLSDLINEIDQSTVQLFSDTFTAVRKNFIEVFTRFFGSGSADLKLTDPENLLTTGVELHVNPPGKRVNNKNLLSGGEKALSALTLLFALFLQKPTPFCFLDEVDAPLDDVNAARFIAMVRSLSNNTQFVIITHKHQTMASADSLYGVTMQEGGVSTMLSVELA